MLFKLFSPGPLVIVLFKRGSDTDSVLYCTQADRMDQRTCVCVCVWEGFAPLIKATRNSI